MTNVRKHCIFFCDTLWILKNNIDPNLFGTICLNSQQLDSSVVIFLQPFAGPDWGSIFSRGVSCLRPAHVSSQPLILEMYSSSSVRTTIVKETCSKFNLAVWLCSGRAHLNLAINVSLQAKLILHSSFLLRSEFSDEIAFRQKHSFKTGGVS